MVSNVKTGKRSMTNGKSLSLTPKKEFNKKKEVPKMKDVIEISSSYVESLDDVDHNQENSVESPLAQKDYEDDLEEKTSPFGGSIQVILKELKKLSKMVHNQKPKNLSKHQKKLNFSPEKNPNTREKIIAGKDSHLFVNMEPIHNSIHDGMKSTVQIPKWLPMSFVPPPGLILDDVQASVAAYIFGANKDDIENGEEMLVRTNMRMTADRKSLRTLLPNMFLHQEVLILVACMLTSQERSAQGDPMFWFLPSIFSQYLLDWKYDLKKVMKCYYKDFMGKIETLWKIFVPINDDAGHWYLLIVDMKEQKLTLLDSLPDHHKAEARIRSVKKLALFLEELFLDDSFYKSPFTYKPQISTFAYETEQDKSWEQAKNSNDCGVWVCKWMMECRWSSNYKVKVDTSTRMELALHLVLDSYNNKKQDIIKLAAANWKKMEQKKKCIMVD